MTVRLRVGIDGRVLDDRYHGIGRVAYELVTQLVQRDECDVVLFLSSTQHTSRFDIDSLISAGQIEIVDFEHGISGLTQFLFWPAALNKARVDLSLFPYHLGASMVGGGRRYSVLHDCIFETDRRYAISAMSLLLYRIATAIITRRSAVLAPSAAAAAQISKRYRIKAQVIAWGVQDQFGTSVQALDLPARYYLHVGAHRPHKNVAFLIEVLSQLGPDEHLVLVGTADDRWPDDIDSAIEQWQLHDRVLKMPHVDEDQLRQLYAHTQAFLYPSFVEGFGLPLLEAMAAGTPVIASDISVFREVAGDAALFADPRDAASWVAAISKLADPELRQRQLDRGRLRAAEATWTKAGDRLHEILGITSSPR